MNTSYDMYPILDLHITTWFLGPYYIAVSCAMVVCSGFYGSHQKQEAEKAIFSNESNILVAILQLTGCQSGLLMGWNRYAYVVEL